MVRGRKWVVAAVLTAATAFVTVWWLQRPEGNRTLDQSAQRVADAVSYPRQRSADGLLNAVLDHGQWAVLQARDLDHDDLQDWMAELVIHHHQDAYEGPTIHWKGRHEAVDACYRLRFNHYRGVSERVHCPRDLTALSRSKSAPAPFPVATCRSGGENDCPGG